MAKERLILSHEARRQIEADVQAFMADMEAAARRMPGASVSAYGGSYASAGWTKTPKKIEVPDIYGAVDLNSNNYVVLSAYIAPDWNAVDRGQLAYILTVFQGGTSRNSKAAPYVRAHVAPGDRVGGYISDAYAQALEAYPVLRKNTRRHAR